jgi:peptidoglycan/LPS O-acetylase OafA/YrhL
VLLLLLLVVVVVVVVVVLLLLLLLLLQTENLAVEFDHESLLMFYENLEKVQQQLDSLT